MYTLPAGRAPTRADWTRLSGPWREQVAARIRELQALQDTLDGCLGCSCLSLTRCKLYNPNDEASRKDQAQAADRVQDRARDARSSRSTARNRPRCHPVTVALTTK